MPGDWSRFQPVVVLFFQEENIFFISAFGPFRFDCFFLFGPFFISFIFVTFRYFRFISLSIVYVCFFRALE